MNITNGFTDSCPDQIDEPWSIKLNDKTVEKKQRYLILSLVS